MYACMRKNIFASFGNVQDLICSWKKLLTKRTCLWCLLMGLAHGLQSQTGMQRKDEKGVSTGRKHYAMQMRIVADSWSKPSSCGSFLYSLGTSWDLNIGSTSIASWVHQVNWGVPFMYHIVTICRVSPQLINHGLLMRNWHWMLIDIKTD